ncbi:hypothetical protein GFD17_04775 [Bifidobacterium sp. SMB2]|uniref:TetR family transcriptional regulator n=1 Tax=Bifidobacterium saimiriisciurei TaxID=2661627 RepID=A0ABX0C6P4_9BIFI|nr:MULTISPECIES: TetR/AcrR family transcriptional regulator [Bifidobacterium]NEG96081.1 hypothetical protein [Bifidobacterium sp. SMB2]NEH10841.1 hypothetical protein [Bifidobacterium saimiriisciurei]
METSHADPPPVAPKPRDDVEHAIERALIDLLNEGIDPAGPTGHVELPSVKTLCAKAFVARSTFYAHYHHVGEVLETLERRLVEDLEQLNKPLTIRDTDDENGCGASHITLMPTLAYIRSNENAFRALLVSAPDVQFIERWKDAIKRQCRQRMTDGSGAPRLEGPRRPTVNRELILEIVASSMVSATAFWLHDPSKVHEQGVDGIVNTVFGALDALIVP